jgi:hypothetical protein
MSLPKKVAVAVAVLVLIAGAVWLLRSDPVFMISGKELTGELASYPRDWKFSDDYPTIAIETRPHDPHSVTTLCFVHEGDLYVPAQDGSSKEWTQYATAEPRVRIKIGEKIYPAKAERVLPLDLALYQDSIEAKYPEFADRSPEELPVDIWLFRIRPLLD